MLRGNRDAARAAQSDTIMSEWERPISAMKAKSLKSVIVSKAPLALKPRRRRSLRSGARGMQAVGVGDVVAKPADAGG